MFDEQFEVIVHGKYGVIPVKMEEGSVGYDIALPEEEGDLILPYNTRRCIDTGVVIKPPVKCFELIVLRSSSRKKGIRISNTVGVIDPSYCGKDDTIRVDITREPKKLQFTGKFPLKDDEVEYAAQHRAITEGWVEFPFFAECGLIDFDRQNQFVNWCKEREITLNACKAFIAFEENAIHLFEEPENTYKVYEAGERFCQVLFLPYYRPDLLETKLEDLDGANRGGFGSTGA